MEDPMSLLPEDDEMRDELIEQGTEAIFQLGLRLNREEARAVFVAALAAVEASGTHRVVPVELTTEMRSAIWSAMFDSPIDSIAPVMLGAGHDAMLSAAPKLGGEP